jgi:hypothetical protein
MNPKTEDGGSEYCLACFGCIGCSACVPVSTIFAFSTMGANSVIVG